MNICFLNTLTGFGGLEMQNILRAKDSIRNNHSPIVIVNSNTRSEKFAIELELPTVSMDTNWFYLNFSFGHKLKEIFRKYRIDICIVPKSELLFSAIFAKKISKRPLAIIFYQQMQSKIRKRDPYHNFIYRNLDSAIVLTELMKKELIETTILPPEKVYVVPYGINFHRFQEISQTQSQLREKFNLPIDKFIVGCLGRIEPHKGQMILAEAFARANLPNSTLLLVGAIDDANYFKQLKEFINRRGLVDSFIYQEFTTEVPKILKSLDVFVLPSNSETFGLVLIEAMASGVPVLATNSGGVPEIIEDRTDGLLFEPKSSEQLAKLLQTIYNNPEVVQRITRLALEKVQIKFDYEKNVNKFFEVCHNTYRQAKI